MCGNIRGILNKHIVWGVHECTICNYILSYLQICYFFLDFISSAVTSLMNRSIADVIKTVELSGSDEDALNALTAALREAFQTWVSTLT